MIYLPATINIRVLADTDWEFYMTFLSRRNEPLEGLLPETFEARLTVRVGANDTVIAGFRQDGNGSTTQEGQIARVSSYQLAFHLPVDQTVDIPPGAYQYDLRIKQPRSDTPGDFFGHSQRIYALGRFTVDQIITERILF